MLVRGTMEYGKAQAVCRALQHRQEHCVILKGNGKPLRGLRRADMHPQRFFGCGTDWRGWGGSREISRGIIQLARTRVTMAEAESNLSLYPVPFLLSEPPFPLCSQG